MIDSACCVPDRFIVWEEWYQIVQVSVVSYLSSWFMSGAQAGGLIVCKFHDFHITVVLFFFPLDLQICIIILYF